MGAGSGSAVMTGCRRLSKIFVNRFTATIVVVVATLCMPTSWAPAA
jgi:hypothetical protein